MVAEEGLINTVDLHLLAHETSYVIYTTLLIKYRLVVFGLYIEGS